MTEKYDLEKIKNSVICGDALTELKKLSDVCVDMILCDLPYGTTACAWDTIIPFEPLWEQYKRIIKDNGAIVLTASQPFTSALVMSNIKMFKYEWIWDKKVGSGFLNANKMPMKNHENILVFYKKQPIYNKQMRDGLQNHSKGKPKPVITNVYGNSNFIDNREKLGNKKNPLSIIQFEKIHPSVCIHPTQKPVALFEYLIKTYTNEGDLVLDNCIGSGTTAVAAINTGRNFIGIELNKEYCEIAKKRIASIPNSLF